MIQEGILYLYNCWRRDQNKYKRNEKPNYNGGKFQVVKNIRKSLIDKQQEKKWNKTQKPVKIKTVPALKKFQRLFS